MTNKPMLSERDKFEAFWRSTMNVQDMDLHRCEFPMTAYDDQPYACHETDRSWMTWQARAILDKPAVKCQGEPVTYWYVGDVGGYGCLYTAPDKDGIKLYAVQHQAEPVAWVTQCLMSGLIEQAEPNEKATNPQCWSDAFSVFAEQPAPVALYLPDQMHADQNRLVRELDVLLNGEAGAAKQASLCDIVAQVRLKRDLLIASLNQGAPADLRFPTMLRKMWSGGEVQQWIEAQGPLYRKAPVLSGANAALQRVYDVIGLDYSHDVSVLIENFKNIKRFSDYLRAIEREFFMVPGEPSDDPEDAGCEPDDECLVNCWGSTQEQYVEQFRNALAYLISKAGPADVGGAGMKSYQVWFAPQYGVAGSWRTCTVDRHGVWRGPSGSYMPAPSADRVKP